MIGRILGAIVIFMAGNLAGGVTVDLFGFWLTGYFVTHETLAITYVISVVLVLLGYHLIVSDPMQTSRE